MGKLMGSPRSNPDPPRARMDGTALHGLVETWGCALWLLLRPKPADSTPRWIRWSRKHTESVAPLMRARLRTCMYARVFMHNLGR